MKAVAGLVMMCLGLGSLAAAAEPSDHGVWVKDGAGHKIEWSRLTGLDGASIPPPQGMVLLHFWATWCAPCLEELPQLNDSASALPPVLAVAEDRDGAAVKAFMAQHGGMDRVTVLLDPAHVMAKELGISVVPTSVVVKDRREVDRLVGPGSWGAADQARVLEH